MIRLKLADKPWSQAAVWAVVFGLANCVTLRADLGIERVQPVPEGEPIPLVDFFRPPLFDSPRLNPAGTHVAALSSGGQDVVQVVVTDLATNESWQISGVEGQHVHELHWLDDDHLIFRASANESFRTSWFAAREKGARKAYPILQLASMSVVGIPLEDPLHPVVWLDSGEVTEQYGEVVTLDLANFTSAREALSRRGNISASDRRFIEEQNRMVMDQRVTRLARGGRATFGASALGQLSYGITYQDGLETLHVWEKGRWQESRVDMETIDIIGPGPEENQVVVLRTLYDGEPGAVHLMDLSNGRLGDEIFRDKNYDLNGGLIVDPGTRALVGLSHNRPMPTFIWYDEGYQRLHETFRQSFPNKIVRIESANFADDVFVLGVYDDREPTTYHVANLKERTMGPLQYSRPWLDAKRLARVSVIKYKTSDGQQLDAFVTVPAGASPKKPVPLVVLPNATLNPFSLNRSRVNLGYHEMAQFLASRGYGVLQPHTRGMPGTDWMFPQTDRWDLNKMTDDVLQAARTALKTKLFDADRIAILGENFGGHLAVAGAVEAPDMFVCVVGISGFYNWQRVVDDLWESRFTNPVYARLVREWGHPSRDGARYDTMNPLLRIDRMKAPMLVTHGRNISDFSRPESDRMVSALRRAKVPVEQIYTDREGWGHLDMENRLKVLAKVESFLAEHLR